MLAVVSTASGQSEYPRWSLYFRPLAGQSSISEQNLPCNRIFEGGSSNTASGPEVSSGVCGGARSMEMLVAGRTVQGLGGGGIQSVSAIVLADLVPLRERSAYAGILGMYGLPSPLRSGSH